MKTALTLTSMLMAAVSATPAMTALQDAAARGGAQLGRGGSSCQPYGSDCYTACKQAADPYDEHGLSAERMPPTHNGPRELGAHELPPYVHASLVLLPELALEPTLTELRLLIVADLVDAVIKDVVTPNVLVVRLSSLERNRHCPPPPHT